MKVLMVVRPSFYISPGGDTTQVEMTARYLRRLGVSVDIALAGEKVDFDIYDLFHFFNIIRPYDILPYLRFKPPYVISTIFVDYSEYEKSESTGIRRLAFRFLSAGQIEYLKAVARWIKNGEKIRSLYYLIRGHKVSMKKIVNNSALLLPNSHSEFKRLKRYLNIDVPYQKVVNAIDCAIFSDSIEADNQFNDYVVCVARIEGLKNQYNLIKALAELPFPVALIGKVAPNHKAYFEQCLNLTKDLSNIQFFDHISHDRLVRIFKAARVHILPSWFETTGLSSLEAGAMNCNVVVTPKGDTVEYFGDMVYYCDPADVASIRDAVLTAYHAPPNDRLKRYILDNYTWEKTAIQTLKAYELALEKKK